ncbi:MAG: glycosyltransferase [Pseudomonadota bacterium]
MKPDIDAVMARAGVGGLLPGKRRALLMAAARAVFDANFYVEVNSDIASAGFDAFDHYMQSGWADGRSPHPLFDAEGYLRRYRDVVDAGVNPLLHYLSVGWKEHRRPHPLFDVEWYLNHNSDVAKAGIEPWSHYVVSGWREGRVPNPLFDPVDYARRCGLQITEDAKGPSPLVHYATQGWRQGISPHPLFDVPGYLARYEDIASMGTEPLGHYLTQGWRERRQPHALFDPEFYLTQRPDLVDAGSDLFTHYLYSGWKEGAKPNRYFDGDWYLETNQDVAAAGINPLLHYVSIGWKESYSPHPMFDVVWYQREYPDVHLAGLDPLRHFIESGSRERRDPHPFFDMRSFTELNSIPETALTHPLQTYLEQSSDGVLCTPHPVFSLTPPEHGNAPHSLPTPDELSRGIRNNGSDLHPLIDQAWYSAQTGVAVQDAALHFMTTGWRAGDQPNPFFDTNWYRDTHMHGDRGENPLCHYARAGWKQQLAPSKDFEPAWYTNEHMYSGNGDPLTHFLTVGQDRGYAPRPPEQPKLMIGPTPFVSVLVVNWNGARFLTDVLDSLAGQTYQNFETIVVDNASVDESIAVLEDHPLKKTIVASHENLGFSGGNNLALQHARGEVIALLNNDAIADKRWLESLVNALHNDPTAAATTSKVLFQGRFLNIDIHLKGTGLHFCYEHFIEMLNYGKVAITSDHTDSAHIPLASGETLSLIVPLEQEIAFPFELINGDDSGGVSVSFRFAGRDLVAQCEADGEKVMFVVKPTDHEAALSHHVLNNAGSAADADGYPYDRGFFEVDRGQYDRAEYVEYLCGCAFGLKRAALRTDHLFFEEFFAYYEDSELSERIRRRGFNILYCPSSVVHHYHSATSVEKSGRWRILTSRNRILFDLLRIEREELDGFLNHELGYLNHLKVFHSSQTSLTEPEEYFLKRIPEIEADLRSYSQAIKDGALNVRRNYTRAGVYNSFWATKGGGEAHALMIAKQLEAYGEVDLICESPFDKEALGTYFGIDTSRMHMRVIGDVYDDLSREYDIFVNSTFLSKLPSYAEKSIFIVSFPSRQADPDFLRSYQFWANSQFTLSWCRRWWGDIDATVLNPTVRDDLIAYTPTQKKRVILNVGRFMANGHSKKQMDIVDAFRRFLSTSADSDGWTLRLVGSLDVNAPEDVAYWKAVKDRAAGLPVVIEENAPYAVLLEAMKEASVYWHMTGYGENINQDPELFEHFGMTVAEAIGAGAYPVVLDAAGPKDIVDTLGYGETADSPCDLADKTAAAIHRLGLPIAASAPPGFEEAYSSRALAKRVTALLGYDGLVQTRSSEAVT